MVPVKVTWTWWQEWGAAQVTFGGGGRCTSGGLQRNITNRIFVSVCACAGTCVRVCTCVCLQREGIGWHEPEDWRVQNEQSRPQAGQPGQSVWGPSAARVPSSSGDVKSVFFLLGPSTEWRGPTHGKGDYLLYSMSTDLNVNFLQKIPSQKHLEWCLTNYLGSVAWPSRHVKLKPLREAGIWTHCGWCWTHCAGVEPIVAGKCLGTVPQGRSGHWDSGPDLSFCCGLATAVMF